MTMRFLTAPPGFGQSDCERIAGEALAQPVLAVTSLAYVAAGLVVLCWAVCGRSPLASGAAVVLVAIGIGSFAYHGPAPSWAKPAHDLPIIAAGVVYVALLARGRRRQWRSIWAPAAGLFAVGLIAYAAGRSGSPMCRPDSLWQYHGVWHVLSAMAAGWAAGAASTRRPAWRRRQRCAPTRRDSVVKFSED